MSRGRWGEVQGEVDKALDVAERRSRCLCVSSDRTRALLARRVHYGELVSPFPRVYARVGYWRSLDLGEQALHVARAAAMLHPDWVFCGTTAALAFGLQVSEPDPSVVHVLDTGLGHGHGGVHVVRHSVGPGSGGMPEPVRLAGIATTPLCRTIADCLHDLPMPQGLAVADSAMHGYGLSQDDLRAFVEDVHFSRGTRRALDTVTWADARSENGGESVARGTMIELGYRVPELQVVVQNPLEPRRTYRVDYAWDKDVVRPIFGELDGYLKYFGGSPLEPLDERVLLDERKRESRLTLYDAAIMRFTFWEVKNRPRFDRLLASFGVPKA